MAKPWYSTFDSGELVVGAMLGIEPLGQVYGCSVQRISLGFSPGVTGEFSLEKDVFYGMLSQCEEHLRVETKALGANAVLGIVLDWRRVDDSMDHDENDYHCSSMKLSGIAVRDALSPSGEIYLATADIADVFALRKADYLPAGLAIGSSTFYQVAWRQVPKLTGPFGTWANEEIHELTAGPSAAREIALSRMSDQARTYGAVGVVGVKLTTEIIPSGTLQGSNMAVTCRFLCIGTAIRRKSGPVEGFSITPQVPLK